MVSIFENVKEDKIINQYILALIDCDVEKYIPLVIMKDAFTNPQTSSWK